jgi:hypothetical protein
MIPTSRSASFKAMMSLWCFVFFSNFESFSGTGHILSREKITHSWSLRNVRCSLRRLLQLTGNYFQAPLYMVRMSSLFHYRYIVMHTTKDMHIKGGEHWRLSCNLQKGRLTAVAFAPPIGFYLPYFCVSWLWHEYMHDP